AAPHNPGSADRSCRPRPFGKGSSLPWPARARSFHAAPLHLADNRTRFQFPRSDPSLPINALNRNLAKQKQLPLAPIVSQTAKRRTPEQTHDTTPAAVASESIQQCERVRLALSERERIKVTDYLHALEPRWKTLR